MKRNADTTMADVLAALRTADPETVARVGGVTSPDERARAVEALRSFTVMVLCAGCGTSVPADDASCCACGGFVCRACEALETDGVCEHDEGLEFTSGPDGV